jgi:hypothetical protein
MGYELDGQRIGVSFHKWTREFNNNNNNNNNNSTHVVCPGNL